MSKRAVMSISMSIGLGILFSISLPARQTKLRVISKNAYILTEPGDNGRVVRVVGARTELNSMGREGDWFRVFLPRQEGEELVSGYIHGNDVRPVVESSELETRKTAAPGMSRPWTYMSVGGGIGIPYGGIAGFNVEIHPFIHGKDWLSEYFGVSLAAGFCYPGIGFNAGLRGYPMGRHRTFQPRIGFYLGSVGFIKYWSDSDILYGGTVGTGSLIRLGRRSALDVELLLIVFYFGYDFSDLDQSPFKVSIGYRMNL